MPLPKTWLRPLNDAIEAGGPKFAEAVVAPISVNEPGVDLGEVRDLGLQEEAGTTASGVWNLARAKGVDQRRSRSADRPEQDRDVAIAVSECLQPSDGVSDPRPPRRRPYPRTTPLLGSAQGPAQVSSLSEGDAGWTAQRC